MNPRRRRQNGVIALAVAGSPLPATAAREVLRPLRDKLDVVGVAVPDVLLVLRDGAPALSSSTARAPVVALNSTSSKETEMKKVALPSLVLALVLPATAALAQQKMDDMKPMDTAKKPAAAAKMTHTAMGTVKKVDAKAGMVTLAHEPVKSMNWPAMTMAFKVKDKMLFDKLADGKKVEFEFVPEGKDYVLTSVK